MLDGIINNRKEWNAKKEEYEAKLKAIEDEKAAKAAAAASKGASIPATLKRDGKSQLNLNVALQLLRTTPAAAPRPAPCAEGQNARFTTNICSFHVWEQARKRRILTAEKLRHRRLGRKLTLRSRKSVIFNCQSGVQGTFFI